MPLRQVWIVAVFGVLAIAYLLWGWCDEITDLQGDSSGYLLAAQYLSPFHAASPLLSAYGKSIFYPTLFPILIGLFGGSALAGHLVVIFSLLAALICLFLWLKSEGISPAISLWTTIAFALMPGTYLLALNIWTENSYLLSSLLALLLARRSEKENDTRLLMFAAVAVAAGPLIRVAGLPLLMAFGLYLLMRRPRGWIGASLIAAVPFFAWTLWSRMTQAGIGGYTSQWATLYSNDPLGTLLRQIQAENAAVLIAWTQAWIGESGTRALYFPVLLIGIAGVAGTLRRLLQLRFDAIYVVIYALELFAWPHPEEAPRYAYVLFPIVIAQGVLLLYEIGSSVHAGHPQLTIAVLLSVASLLLFPSLLLTLRLATSVPPEHELARHIQDWYQSDRRTAEFASDSFVGIIDDLKRVDAEIPVDACIFSIKPNPISLYSRRLTYRPPASQTSDADFELGIRQCRYAYLLSYISPSFDQALYPYPRLPHPLQALSTVQVDDHNHREPAMMAMLVDLGDQNTKTSTDSSDGATQEAK